MQNLTRFVQRILELMKRYPGVIALAGFISGVGSFILVDRQQGLASWITTIMLISWIWLMLENSLTKLFTRIFKREIPEPLLRYATQMIHQESLFFVLPFFFITTTWNSGQLFFTGLLGVAALISIIDPLYYKWLAPRRWAFLALHTLTLFAALLTALPVIMHLTTAQSFKWALGISVLLSFPSLASIFPIRTLRSALAILSITLGIGAVGWELRSWVPPATLWMTDVAISTQMQDRTPGASLDEVSAERSAMAGFTRTPRSMPRVAWTSGFITSGSSTAKRSTASLWIFVAGARKVTGPGPTSRISRATRPANGRSGC